MTETQDRPRPNRVSRRAALRAAGFGIVGLTGAALIGCTGDDAPEATPTPTPTPTPTATNASTPAQGTPPVVPKPSRGGTLNLALERDPRTLDPYGTLNTDTKAVGAHSYQRLYKRETSAGGNGGETRPGPDLAVTAETDDGATWTIKLRDHKFHNLPPVDGRKITSEDVVFSTRLLRATEAPNSPEVSNWINVEAPDDSTVVFTLDQPSATFPEQIADANLLQILPLEADGRFDPKVTMIGSGPWIMREYQPSVGFEFDANPDYYEIAEDGQSLPYVDKLSRPIVLEYPHRLALFLDGHLDGLPLNNSDVIDIRNFNPDLQWLNQVSQLQSIFFWSNPQTTDAAWKDDRFRRAVSMALDRDRLTDIGYGTSALRDAGLPVDLVWNNIIPAGWGERWWLDPQSAAHGPSGEFFQHQIPEAIKMLAAAGVEDRFSIPYFYTGRYGGPFPRIAEAHVDMLRAVGLDPVTEIQEFYPTYTERTFRGDFEGMAFGYETAFLEAGSYLNRMFGDDPANHSNISDPRIDEIAAAQAVEFNEDQRRALLHEAQILNAEKMWYVPSQAGAGTSYTAYQKYLQGGVRDTLGYGAGTEEYIWYWIEP